MATTLICLALIPIIAFIIPLAVLGVGIRSQERARCLICEPPGITAALARRLIGLSVSRPFPGECPTAWAHPASDHESMSALDEDETAVR
jgi:hypothetical protein